MVFNEEIRSLLGAHEEEFVLNPLYIVWKEEYSVGIPILDEQHRAIIATLNSLYFFIQEGWGLSALQPTLKIIKVYSSFHAKTEEGLLSKFNYPHLNKHIDCQKRFEKHVDEATHQAILNRDPQILLKFLRDWWIGHLTVEHKQYANYMSQLRESRYK